MDKSKVIYVSGYRSFELGVFKENDPKIQVVKNVLKRELRQLAEEGVEWILVSGNLGVELWTVQTVADFGNNWNEGNQEKKQLAEQLADYVEAVSHQPYQSPSQLKNHTRFILEHTVGCLLIYDEEFSGKTKYFFEDAQNYQADHPYEIRLISMDDLQNFSE